MDWSLRLQCQHVSVVSAFNSNLNLICKKIVPPRVVLALLSCVPVRAVAMSPNG